MTRVPSNLRAAMRCSPPASLPLTSAAAMSPRCSKKKGAPVEWIKNPDPLVVQPATVQIAKQPPHPNSARLLIDFLLSEQVAELLAKDQRLPGRTNASGLDPAFKEINAEKILPLSIEEVQANFRKYLEEYRTYFGK